MCHRVHGAGQLSLNLLVGEKRGFSHGCLQLAGDVHAALAGGGGPGGSP